MSAIKHPILFGISMLLGLVVLGLGVDRLIFLAHARHTTGTVAGVYASNTTCSCGRGCSYACTEFNAVVRFPQAEHGMPLVVRAGTARGHFQPLGLAMYRTGSPVPVVYNPRNTNQAFRDGFTDLWATPAEILMFQVATLVGSLAKWRSSGVRPSLSPSADHPPSSQDHEPPLPSHQHSASNYFLSGAADAESSDGINSARGE